MLNEDTPMAYRINDNYYHHETLTPLSTLDDWELGDSDQDIRGWQVYDTPDHSLGEVEDLLVDRDAEVVQAIRLTNGKEIAAEQILIGEDAVYLKDMSISTPYVRVYD